MIIYVNFTREASDPMNKKTLGIIYVLLTAVLWGFYPVFTRILYANGVTVAQAVSARALITGGIYLIWGLCTHTFGGLRPRDYLFFAFYGLTAILGTYSFYALAIRYLSSAMAAMLLYTAPAFVILFNRIFYGDKITPIKLTALITTFFGSCLVVRIYDPSALSLNLVGILLGLLSGISYSLLTVIGRKALKNGYKPLQNTFLPTIFAAVAIGCAVPPWTLPVSPPLVIFAFLGAAVIGSVLPYWLYQKGLATGLDGSIASLLCNLEPVMSTVFGCLLFADQLEIRQILGIVIVLAGASLPELAGHLSQKPAAVSK